MSREKNKVTKRMSPENSPSENYRLAQFGEFWETTEFVQAWHWKFMLTLWSIVEASKRNEAVTFQEIGAVVGKAIAEGNWRYLELLAKAVEFVNERYNWTAKTPGDLMLLLRSDLSKFEPVDQLRALIISEYFMLKGGPVEDAKRTRKAFMPYIAAKLNRKVDAKGAFAKAFDRACKDVGIKWRK